MLLIVTAEVVVLSVLLSPSLTRTPVSSVNASLVPEPSSLVTTEIVFDASNFAASEPASDEPFDEEPAPPQYFHISYALESYHIISKDYFSPLQKLS